MKVFLLGHFGIQEKEIERQTENSVYFNGRRHSRVTSYESYHSTWEDAHAEMMSQAQAAVEHARGRLARLNGDLGRIKGMKQP